ncbi:hypothetical protein [Nocardia sp. NPDC059239]|uniref:hypothetical protein n=1 Tax=unclassified Nocardia TaxID=2637762 RepID=UPI0036CEB351
MVTFEEAAAVRAAEPHRAAAARRTAAKYAVELIGTFFLVFTVGTAVRSVGPFAPLAIGAVLMGMFAWPTLWVYLTAQLIAGAAAGAVFLALDPDDR